MRNCSTLTEMLDELRRIARTQPGMTGQREMCELVLASEDVSVLAGLSPFSETYKLACRELHGRISGVADYDVMANELVSNFSVETSVSSPTPYCYGESTALGEFFLSWGAILQCLNVKRGQSVIEYGAGEGQLAIALARMGCEVTVVDVEQRYLDSIAAQCARLGVSITLHRGLFGESPGNRRYDRVVFFEAFHHSLDHQALARQLHSVVADDGYIVFAGEPIVESSPFVPFPWGPRLDGLSVYSMNEFGWMELGFQERYFVEMLMRSGWLVTARRHPMTFRGNCYIARPLSQRIHLGDDFLILQHDHDTGWDAPEGTHRWTRGQARFPMSEEFRGGGCSVTLSLANYLPLPRAVEVVSGRHRAMGVIPAGDAAELTAEIDPAAADLEVRSEVSRVSDAVPGSADQRSLGVAVLGMAFHLVRHG